MAAHKECAHNHMKKPTVDYLPRRMFQPIFSITIELTKLVPGWPVLLFGH